MTTTRRALLGATAAFAALPLSAFSTAAASATPAAPAAAAATSVRALWDEVIDLSIRLGGHPTPMVAQDTGLPGWMYVEGEANALGNARYDKLIALMNSKPETAEDLAIIARASTHYDLQSGPRSFAAAKLALASQSLAA